MPDLTTNYELKKPLSNENYDIGVQNQNMDAIDTALTPTADPAQVPTGNGPGKLVQWVSWLANRIKAITGKVNWYDAPDITLASLAQHKSRHATGGADALAPADIGAAAASDLAAHSAAKATSTTLGHIKQGNGVNIDENGTISVTKDSIGLGNVINEQQMPIAGGTFTGIVVAQNNTSYTTKQIRNIVISTSDPAGGGNGDIWLKYTS